MPLTKKGTSQWRLRRHAYSPLSLNLYHRNATNSEKMIRAIHVGGCSSGAWVGVPSGLTGCEYVSDCSQSRLDKEAVQNYKAEIKAHLLRLGLIRGQPRPNFMHSSPSTPSGGTTNVLPFTSAPGIHTFHHQDAASAQYGFRLDDSHIGLTFPSGPHDLGVLPSASSAGFSVPSPLPLGTPDFYESSMFTFQPASASPSSSQGHQNMLQFDTFSAPPERPHEYDTHALGMAAGADQNDNVRREHIVYYFNHVRGLQHLFSSKAATDAAYAIIEQEPQGALSNAICALSNLHYSSTQCASGFQSATRDQLPDDSLAQFFQSQAAFQLQNARQHGQYTEHDAMAALHLTSYSLSSTGGKAIRGLTEWGAMLEIASDWLTETNMHIDENPKLTLVKMSSPSAFAVKATMCMDIFMSVTLQQPPRLLALYRRLLGRGSGYWATSGSRRGVGSSGKALEEYDVRMDQLIGCNDVVMLALAEISALAHWKAQEQRNRSLSVRELVTRGQEIERMLHQTETVGAGFVETSQAAVEVGSSTRVASVMVLPAPQSGRPFSQHMSASDDLSRRLVAAIYQETAMLYLNTVISGNNPNVPEILRSISLIVQLLSQLPAGIIDCALLLPLFLTGCMTDAPAHRELIRNRLVRVGEDSTNVRQAAAVMVAAWQRRDASGAMIDWRDVMQEQGLSLLLI
ncbi:hypothetical protein EW146_g7047 [Bondarzewia mesenterica]|uniref:Uncharacterized protein n=1 Tax=Bondarzewia mesenterica TaxID=1095465 RepID=A0A4S4LSK7_9AGAM|nr:hypothetical protein EW146_g7047 [Bondarzewia mesenterica]